MCEEPHAAVTDRAMPSAMTADVFSAQAMLNEGMIVPFSVEDLIPVFMSSIS